MNESVTVTIVAGNKKVDNIWPIPDVPKCKVKQSFKRTVTINEEILTPEQVALLKAAANNVKYIAETSDIKLQAEEIWGNIPSEEILQQLKTDLENGTKTIPDIEEVGFVNYHDGNTFSFYWVVDGDKTDVSSVNIFDPASLSEAIMDSLL